MVNLPDLYNHITHSSSLKRDKVKSSESFPVVFKAVYASGEMSFNILYLLDTLYVYRVPKRAT